MAEAAANPAERPLWEALLTLVPPSSRSAHAVKYTSVPALIHALRAQQSPRELRGRARKAAGVSPALRHALACVLGSASPCVPPAPAGASRGRKRPRSPPAVPVGARDPITLAPLAEAADVFTYRRGADSVGAFDVAALVPYLLATGDFRDPETRVPFTPEQLAALDVAAVAAGQPPPSRAKAARREEYTEAAFRSSALTGVERLAEELVAEALVLLEGAPFSPAAVQRSLQLEVFPQLGNVLEQMAGLDRSATLDALDVLAATVAGPAKRPTPNPLRHREAVAAFLDHVRAQVVEGSRPTTISVHAATEAAFALLQRVQETECVLPLSALADVGLSALGAQLGRVLGPHAHATVALQFLEGADDSDGSVSDSDSDGEPVAARTRQALSAAEEEAAALFALLDGGRGLSTDVVGGGMAASRVRRRGGVAAPTAAQPARPRIRSGLRRARGSGRVRRAASRRATRRR